MKGEAMKFPKKKVIITEVETYRSNKAINILIRDIFRSEGMFVKQVQVNEIKSEKPQKGRSSVTR